MQFLVLALRLTGVAIGVTLIVIGVPLTVTPIPLGLLLIALGAILLVVSSHRVARWVRHRRENNPGFDRAMRKTEAALPKLFRSILTSTAPRRDSP